MDIAFQRELRGESTRGREEGRAGKDGGRVEKKKKKRRRSTSTSSSSSSSSSSTSSSSSSSSSGRKRKKKKGKKKRKKDKKKKKKKNEKKKKKEKKMAPLDGGAFSAEMIEMAEAAGAFGSDGPDGGSITGYWLPKREPPANRTVSGTGSGTGFDPSTSRCYLCGQIGHTAPRCPNGSKLEKMAKGIGR
eukprot:TRINITY_DN2293_c3_g1_i1.p2 TRINITY_DN2293_c3_g1~~TRINITY_DN2293_c3_g1_i1.p2  ORF type:complete len:189 (+),score=63.69 TRINITY_DN2293_c3_g1_i1:699-1265(+)